MNYEAEPSSGRPNEVITAENIEKIRKMLRKITAWKCPGLSFEWTNFVSDGCHVCSQLITHHHTLLQWPKSMCWATNCCLVHPISQIWLRATSLFPKKLLENSKVIRAIEGYFEDFEKNTFKDGLIALQKSWTKCIELSYTKCIISFKETMLKNKLMA